MMKVFLALCLAGLQIIVFTACMSSAVMPTAIPDGQASYTYVDEPRSISYTGQWVANTPKGLGQAIYTFYGKHDSTCKGEFGVPEPTTFYGQHQNWGKGEVILADKSVFVGTFTNNFKFGYGCQIRGTGSLVKGKWRIIGNFYGPDSLMFGPCQIQKSTGEQLDGNCSTPAGGTTQNYMAPHTELTSQIWENPFRLIFGKATYIDSKGTRYDGFFNHNNQLHGLYTVTYKNKKPIPMLFEKGKLIHENPSAKVIAQWANEQNRKTQIALQNQAEAQKTRQAEAAAETENSQNNDFQWGKLAYFGGAAAIAGAGSLPAETQATIATAIVKDSMPGETGTSNLGNAFGSTMNSLAADADPGLGAITNAATQIVAKSSAPTTGSTSGGASTNVRSKSGTSASTSGSGDAAQNKKWYQQCIDANPHQDVGNDQVDLACTLVKVNLCFFKKSGNPGLNQEAKAKCLTLRESYGNAACSEPCTEARKVPIK